MDEVQDWLIHKFEEIEHRIMLVIDQLDDDQLNWRPNESSNSISNLLIHINGNMNERIGSGILKKEVTRNRDEEFESVYKSKADLKTLTQNLFRELIETTNRMTDETFRETQRIRNKERTNREILLQCAAHFSEHLGQILYIGKMLLDESYETTSIPKAKPNDKN